VSQLVWLHEDALNMDHPVLRRAGRDALVCFVWDDRYLQQMDYGFKRLVFIYETLCQMPLQIYRGDTVEVLSELAADQRTDSIHIPSTPNPVLQAIATRLQQRMNVETVEDAPFVRLNHDPDVKRFFRYWNKARKSALQHAGGRQE